MLLAKSDELTKGCRTFLEQIKTYLFEAAKLSFFSSDIRQSIRINPYNMRYYLAQLVQYGYLKIVGGNRYKQGLEYEITGYGDYTTLNSQVINTLDVAFDRLCKSVDNSG